MIGVHRGAVDPGPPPPREAWASQRSPDERWDAHNSPGPGRADADKRHPAKRGRPNTRRGDAGTPTTHQRQDGRTPTNATPRSVGVPALAGGKLGRPRLTGAGPGSEDG